MPKPRALNERERLWPCSMNECEGFIHVVQVILMSVMISGTINSVRSVRGRCLASPVTGNMICARLAFCGEYVQKEVLAPLQVFGFVAKVSVHYSPLHIPVMIVTSLKLKNNRHW